MDMQRREAAAAFFLRPAAEPASPSQLLRRTAAAAAALRFGRPLRARTGRAGALPLRRGSRFSGL